jgi:hypothetical protein
LIFLAITPLKSSKTGRSIGRKPALARVPGGEFPGGRRGTIARFNRLLIHEEEHGAANCPAGQELAMASRYKRGLFRDFDFISAFMAFLLGPRMEVKPIPVKVRRRR